MKLKPSRERLWIGKQRGKPCTNCGVFYRVGMDGDVWLHSHNKNCTGPAKQRRRGKA